jgi:hypothetical protein
MRSRFSCLAFVVGLGMVAYAPPPVSAEELNKVVRTLDRILNPQDARRYEERARRSHRPEEERYWRDYRSGLEEQRRGRGTEIGHDQARQFEERARRSHRAEEERYWRDYRGGLGEGRR